MKRFLAALSMVVLSSAGTLAVSASTAGADSVTDCTGTWSVGVGGFTLGPQDSAYIQGVNQRVGYAGWDAQAGLNELGRLVFAHRDACPGDHIKIVGHSQGAGIVHVFAQRNPGFGNANAVLLADPKRPAGPEGPGMSTYIPQGWHLLAGNDGDYGGWATWTVCNQHDGVCNVNGGAFVGNPSHGNYDYNAQDYDNGSNGQDFRLGL